MNLTEEQIKIGFWYYNPKNQWPPKAISRIEEYQPTEHLQLFITQLASEGKLSRSEEKKLIEDWCRKLPTLDEVHYLWFCSRVSQEIFDAVCKMPNLKGLYIKWSSIEHIDHLASLQKLEHLWLGSSSKLESIEVLAQLTGLTTLELQQLNKIHDFNVIFQLKNLQGLGLNGSIWTTQKVNTLQPLLSLKKLRYFTAYNTRILDKSLEPLLALPHLMRVNGDFHNMKKEIGKLKLIPSLKYGLVEKL